MRIRNTSTFVVLVIAAAALLAAAVAGSASATPSRNTVCTDCHSGTASGTVTATPSTTTPAAGAAYTVAISIGLTSSGNTGYHIAQTDAAGTTTTWMTVYGGPASQTSWTANMTAPATPGTYYYKVWCVKGLNNSSGQAKSATYSITVPASVPTAALISLTPNHAQTGASVVIAGTNLGSGGTVRFGGTAASTTAWSATSVTATVPASLAAGATTATVTPTGGAASNALAFTVDAAAAPTAALISLTPNHAQTGASVVIAGTNLGSGGTVRFGTTAASTTAWSATSVTATVPASLAAGASSVTLTPTGGAASSALAFTVDAATVPTATLTSLSPTSGPVGATLIVTGADMGASGSVTVGGITAATSAWSATSITCTVPAGLTIGSKSVVVTPTGGAASNALSFTVTLPSTPTAALISLTPNHAPAGAGVVIAGTDLGSGGTVRFGSTAASTTAWSATSVTATVPASLSAGVTSVTVTPTGGAASNAVAFTVDATPGTGDSAAPTTTASGASAGGWCNGSVTVTLTATDGVGGTGVASITYSVDGRRSVTVRGSSTTVTIAAHSDDGDDKDGASRLAQGPHTITYYATDAAGNKEAARVLTVNVDTIRPSTRAPRAAHVRRHHVATLAYEAMDATPNGGMASVVITVKNSRGQVVKTLRLGQKPVNTPLTATFMCSLRVGTYRFYVQATDAAGNTQTNVASQTLRVRAAH